MPLFTLFRILFSLYLLYFAWPYIPQSSTVLEKYFWGAWLLFLILVIGANLATVLKISSAPLMERKSPSEKRNRNRAETV